MIPEIEKKIKEHLPLVLEEVGCDGPQLYFHGNKWSFSAISSWRIICKSKLIVGSDDGENDLVTDLLKSNVISQVAPQARSFPVDPAFYFSNGNVLEIFSDLSFDTWTFRIPNEPMYDFTLNDSQFASSKQNNFLIEVQNVLPLTVQKFTYNSGQLFLQGKNWNLNISSSWRIVSENNDFYGGAEQKGRDIVDKMKNIQIISVEVQSSVSPIDPIFILSNQCRLELFSSSKDSNWKFTLPAGKIIYN